MNTTTPTAAQSRAFTVLEILNLVLEELDMQTLLVSAQRVCHTWRNVIKETPSLREKLFLRPQNAKGRNGGRVFNPLLAARFRSFIPENDRSTNEPIQCVDLTRLGFIVQSQRQSAYLRPEASWRHMFTKQPPAFTIASIARSVSSHGGDPIGSKGPRQHEDLRMGTLFDWTLSIPGHFFARGVVICFGRPSPVNTPFFNSGGAIADMFNHTIANKDDIMLIEKGKLNSPHFSIYPGMGVTSGALLALTNMP